MRPRLAIYNQLPILIEKGLTIPQMAHDLGVSNQAITMALRRRKLKARVRVPVHPPLHRNPHGLWDEATEFLMGDDLGGYNA